MINAKNEHVERQSHKCVLYTHNTNILYYLNTYKYAQTSKYTLYLCINIQFTMHKTNNMYTLSHHSPFISLEPNLPVPEKYTERVSVA